MSYSFIGIDHVQLAAPKECEQKARHFFGDILGWEEITKPEPLASRGGVWFKCGIHQVHIGVQNEFVPAKKAHPAFHVKQLSLLREHLLNHNIQVIDDDVRVEEGVNRFYTQDPFGNRLEFLSNRCC